MFGRPKYKLQNQAALKYFPHKVEPDNWFDRHPLISGGITGAVFAAVLFFGFMF